MFGSYNLGPQQNPFSTINPLDWLQHIVMPQLIGPTGMGPNITTMYNPPEPTNTVPDTVSPVQSTQPPEQVSPVQTDQTPENAGFDESLESDGGIKRAGPSKKTGISGGYDLSSGVKQPLQANNPGDYSIFENDQDNTRIGLPTDRLEQTRPNPPQDLRSNGEAVTQDKTKLGNDPSMWSPEDTAGITDYLGGFSGQNYGAPNPLNDEKIDFNNIWSFLNPYSRSKNSDVGSSGPQVQQPGQTQQQAQNPLLDILANNLQYLFQDPNVAQALNSWLQNQYNTK